MPNSTPFTDQELHTLRVILGSVVFAGAQIEGAITVLTHALFHVVGPTSAAKVVPWELSRKLKYLKSAFNGGFKDFDTDGRKLLIRVRAFKKVRDPIIHGYVTDFDRASGTVTFARHEIRNNERLEIYNSFAIARLDQAARGANKLALDVALFVQRISSALPE